MVTPEAVSLARGTAISTRPKVPISDRERWPWRWPGYLSPITILAIRRWAAAVARTSQRRLEPAFNHRLEELTYPLTKPDFDRLKPIVEKMDRRLRFPLQSRRRRASVRHGVVSTGAPTPGLIWVSPPGDYAIVNSNHIPDGTGWWARQGLNL